MEWIAFGLIVFFGYRALRNGSRARQTRRVTNNMEELIRAVEEFTPADIYISPHSFTGIAIDRERREVLLADRYSLRRFAAASILSCEILQDNVPMENVFSRSLLFGNIGTIIGGFSGSAGDGGYARKIVLRFLTDDFDQPTHDIVLLDLDNSRKGARKDSLTYRQALETAELWRNRFVAMTRLRKVDSDGKN